MPIYEWICDCGKTLELLQKIGDSRPKCTSCNKTMTKKISKSSFRLIGSGWSKDGYHKQKTNRKEKI